MGDNTQRDWAVQTAEASTASSMKTREKIVYFMSTIVSAWALLVRLFSYYIRFDGWLRTIISSKDIPNAPVSVEALSLCAVIKSKRSYGCDVYYVFSFELNCQVANSTIKTLKSNYVL